MQKKSWYDITEELANENVEQTIVYRDKNFRKAWSGTLPETIKNTIKTSTGTVTPVIDSDTDTKSEGYEETYKVPFSSPEINSSNNEPIVSKLSLLDIVDENFPDKLKCLHYPRQFNTLNPKDESQKDYKGIVIDENNNIISKTLGYTPEYTIDDPKVKEVVIDRCFAAIEGFTISLYFYKNMWRIKTNRKLDAYQSKWGSDVSFGEIFEMTLINMVKNGVVNFAVNSLESDSKFPEYEEDKDILDLYFSKLDITKTYMFIVGNTEENRLVCESKMIMYFIGEFKDGKSNMENTSGIPYPKEYNVKKFSDLETIVNNTDYNKYQGVVIYTRENSTFKLVKILNKTYKELFELRANEPDLDKRYIQLRMLDEKIIDKFFHLYPKYIARFQYWEVLLIYIAKKILQTYINRYKYKKFEHVSSEQHKILIGLLNMYKNTEPTLDNVLNYLDNTSPDELHKLVVF